MASSVEVADVGLWSNAARCPLGERLARFRMQAVSLRQVAGVTSSTGRLLEPLGLSASFPRPGSVLALARLAQAWSEA